MKVAIVFVSLIIFASVISSHPSIVIDIEHEELQRVAEILVESYISHNLTPQTSRNEMRNIIFSIVKKVTLNVVQLIGIMLSLVGANLLTRIFESSAVPQVLINDIDNITSFTPSETHFRDYGCDNNVCWRTCGDKFNNPEKNKQWCYSSPTPESRKYHECLYLHECSPWWECIGICHSPIENTKK